MSDSIARRVIIHGDVQGVFFRDSTQSEADRRGVTGWIRNRDDGAVEGFFEGPADEVDGLIAWCQTGPARATVDEVDVDEAEPEGLSSFDVR